MLAPHWVFLLTPLKSLIFINKSLLSSLHLSYTHSSIINFLITPSFCVHTSFILLLTSLLSNLPFALRCGLDKASGRD